MQKLIDLLSASEELLVEKILEYAKRQKYTKYTSTLKEAWHLSISGLSEALIKVAQKRDSIPEMQPDDDYSKNEISEFGIAEAQKHRSRGITLAMFLGLMKYYQQAYIDLVNESDFLPEEKSFFCQYIKRYFDYLELGFIVEWAGSSEKQKSEELQKANRLITNEKNKYLTVFESLYDPAILIDRDNNIDAINGKAAETFLNKIESDTNYYKSVGTDRKLDILKEDLAAFVALNQTEVSMERTLKTVTGSKTYIIKLKKMLDVSEKYAGTVILFNDITQRFEAEKKLKSYQDKLEYYAFTDPMTGISNRRTGISILEKELYSLRNRETSLSVCYLDVDGLKAVNDTFGHAEGDELLQTIVYMIESTIRDFDLVSRMGGDEFLIVFPDCGKSEAERIVQKICDKLDEYDKNELKPFKHSFSYGIIEINKDSGMKINEVIKAADQKMYEQKLLKKAQK